MTLLPRTLVATLITLGSIGFCQAQTLVIGPQCQQLKPLFESIKALEQRRLKTVVGDLPRRCSIVGQQVAVVERALAVIDSDEERCAIRDEFIDHWRESVERLRPILATKCSRHPGVAP